MPAYLSHFKSILTSLLRARSSLCASILGYLTYPTRFSTAYRVPLVAWAWAWAWAWA